MWRLRPSEPPSWVQAPHCHRSRSRLPAPPPWPPSSGAPPSTPPHGVTWESLSYQNELIHEPWLWNGAAGVALFLAEHHVVTGGLESLELARQALKWALHTARAEQGPPDPYGTSLGKGTAGIGLALLQLARPHAPHADPTLRHGEGQTGGTRVVNAVSAAPDSWALSEAETLATTIAGSPPAERPGLLWGVAGEGLFLLRAAQATGTPALLQAASTRGALLQDTALPPLLETLRAAARGAVPEGARPIPLGLAPGVAGIGVFLAALLDATRDERWAIPLRQTGDALLALATPDPMAPHGLTWPLHTGSPEHARCQWCTGAPGVGIFFACSAEALDEPRFRAAACGAGETAYARGDARGNPSLCHGLAGTAELFLDLHRLTGDEQWHARALDFATRAFAYREPGPDGDVWPADEPGFTAVNLSTGAAGVGRVFLRLLAPHALRSPFT